MFRGPVKTCWGMFYSTSQKKKNPDLFCTQYGQSVIKHPSPPILIQDFVIWLVIATIVLGFSYHSNNIISDY